MVEFNSMKKILVLCTGNSCRSQILEGWLKSFSNGNYLVFSAGIEAHGINKDAVHYMNEVDIDLSNHTSDLIEKYCDVKFDLFVTVCDSAKESCPIIPKSAKVIHRNIDDPSKAQDKPNAFRRAISELKKLAEEVNQLIYP
tara:strand:- start:46 stop:468 length:423 start_codon:yes stop_codon:yes gene_type:complete